MDQQVIDEGNMEMSFAEVQSNLDRCYQLLTKWNWLYRERATHILVSGLLDSEEIQEILRVLKPIEKDILYQIPQGYFKDEWPEELKNFIKECYDLKMKIPFIEVDKIMYDKQIFRGMNPKKKEEATNLAALIARVCDESNISIVIDIGSGLGYMDRLLSRHYNLNVIGLERDRTKILKALEFGDGIEYIVAQIGPDTLDKVMSLLQERLMGKSACLVCLHACGDLSIHTEIIFKRLPEMFCMVNVPCCYHLSSLYPVSTKLKQSGIVTPNLLRLASEKSADKWCISSHEVREIQSFSVLSRAVLQEFIEKEGTEVKKTRRRLVKNTCKTWEEYLECFTSGITGLDKERLSKFWTGRNYRLDEISVYLCLQTSLQAVAELLLLLDRLYLSKENTHIVTRLLRVFKPELSPRSFAIVASK